ncbi:protein LSM12 homolog [Pecten maximus]|uniref:protein LSM12 homolog n=1 Tax=Pecten maximus TaxID=6579 RepID=UPI00145827A4|nr:protein LSM12 homolog [Pecten maximus]
MKIEMAQDGEYFSIGSIVSCTTCYNQKLQGEVLAFDEGTKMLAIKTSAASGKHNRHDIRMVNLTYVSDVKIIQESDEPAPAMASLNLQKITTRLRENLEAKKQKVNYIGIGVSADGQKVFNSIVKTLNDSRWEGKNIVVMDEVSIRPPYNVEDCRGRDGQLLSHVKKIVRKHHVTEEGQKTESRKSMSPSSPSPVSS